MYLPDCRGLDKVALVTGGGAGFALHLSSEEATVFVTDPNHKWAEKTEQD